MDDDKSKQEVFLFECLRFQAGCGLRMGYFSSQRGRYDHHVLNTSRFIHVYPDFYRDYPHLSTFIPIYPRLLKFIRIYPRFIRDYPHLSHSTPFFLDFFGHRSISGCDFPPTLRMPLYVSDLLSN